MALTLVSEISFSKDATKIYVTDKTGEYSATNLTGWGSSNVELAESCLVCLVIRKGSEGDEVFEAITPTAHFIYDDALLNDAETVFEIEWRTDAVIDVVLVRLPVSLDGTTFVDVGGVIEGSYYYYNDVLYHYVGAQAVPITDYTDLVDAVGVDRTIDDCFGTPLLAIKAQEIYKEYRVEREKDCDDAEPILREYERLLADIQGLSYAFYSGLTVEAQNQIEDLLDKHEIIGN